MRRRCCVRCTAARTNGSHAAAPAAASTGSRAVHTRAVPYQPGDQRGVIHVRHRMAPLAQFLGTACAIQCIITEQCRMLACAGLQEGLQGTPLPVSRHPPLGSFGDNNSDDWVPFSSSQSAKRSPQIFICLLGTPLCQIVPQKCSITTPFAGHIW
jgi:hypothetical protein